MRAHTRAMAVAKTVGAGVLGGWVAGIVAGGFGSRVAMRISAVSGPACAGLLTENGNRCGELTLGGTVGLVFFAGLLPGTLGGLLYLAVRRWIARLGAFRGAAFGLALLALLGTRVLDRNNPDFTRFGHPVLNMLMFASLFVLFGVLVAPVTDRLMALKSRGPANVLLIPAAGLGLMFVGALGSATLVPIVVVGVAAVTQYLSRRAKRSRTSSRTTRRSADSRA